MCGSTSKLYSIPLIYIFILILVCTVPGCCSLIVHAEISSVSLPNLLLFFKIILAIPDTLFSHVKFKVSLPIFIKHMPRSIDQFGRIDILTILSLLIHEHDIALHSFRSFCISLCHIL